jgi:acetyltransferase-like isoleucine patch superfamily enzyme
MSQSVTTAKRDYSFKRVGRKIGLSFSMMALMPSSIRVKILSLIGVTFVDRGSAFIGDNVYFDNLDPTLVTLGRWCRVTSGVKFLTHFFDARHKGTPERPFNFHSGKIIIGDHVFIGTGAVFTKSVTVGDWAIIGASTVVSKDVPAGAICAGNPARIVGYRDGFGPPPDPAPADTD